MPRQIDRTEEDIPNPYSSGLMDGGVAYRHDKYWRLADYIGPSNAALTQQLEASNHHIPIYRPDRRTLAHYLQRRDRQLPCYFGCSVAELQQYVKARGLELEQSRRSLTNKLLTALETADANPSFEHLLDLPPELRNRIYECYMSSFGSVLQSPTQPPLTKVSRQIREETLPIFYNTCTFGLALVVHHKQPQQGVAGRGWHLKWHEDTDFYLKSLLPENLALMRSFHIQVVTHIGLALVRDEAAPFVFEVRLGNNRSPYAVELVGRPHIPTYVHSVVFSRWNDNLEALEEEIKAVFEVAGHRVDDQSGEQTSKLMIKDLWAARRTMEARIG
ncbi:hypothetical protein CB0940_09042 [Cercospora beticola]|uniref:Uncharacterized protein n=1 Tax=Cercospora beticola TaxID=122368 RepID=A0A2G5HH54_CERBT|nr:hypothetical protein CB0940_09042 [Cercospora beticola]PIA91563.1 hypothetical protein CB0940_09042 [Cercospora beticola]WPB06683.1 hypothetical protein RHO25_011342 [Cercospora beticola]